MDSDIPGLSKLWSSFIGRFVTILSCVCFVLSLTSLPISTNAEHNSNSHRSRSDIIRAVPPSLHGHAGGPHKTRSTVSWPTSSSQNSMRSNILFPSASSSAFGQNNLQTGQNNRAGPSIKWVSLEEHPRQYWYHVKSNETDEIWGEPPQSLHHLYLLTNIFLDWLQPEGLPPGIVKQQLLEEPELVLRENQTKLISHFWYLVIVAFVLAALGAFLVPLLGFMLCCCCTGRPKRDHTISPRSHRKRSFSYEGACDVCSRNFASIGLFITLLVMAFFVVCAFVTNAQIGHGVERLPSRLNKSVDDFETYLQNTRQQVNTLLKTNYQQLDGEISNKLDMSGKIIKDKLAIISHAVAVTNLTEIVSKLGGIMEDLRGLQHETRALSQSVHQLRMGLIKSREELEKVLEACRRNLVCQEIRQRYRRVMNQFAVSIRNEALPNLEPLMKNVSDLLKEDIVTKVKNGKDSFDGLSDRIQEHVNEAIPFVKEQIAEVGKLLNTIADEINRALIEPMQDTEFAKEVISDGEFYVARYEIWRWYGGLIAAALMLFILVLYTIGWIKVSCSAQPTVYDIKARRKPFSLSCGILTTFLLFTPFILGALVLMFAGTLSDQVGCYYLQNPSKPQTKQLISVLEKKYQVMKGFNSFTALPALKSNIADVINRCHANMSLYNVLQLAEYGQSIKLSDGETIEGFNLTHILDVKRRYRIRENLDELLKKIEVDPRSVVLIGQEGQRLLARLRDTSLGTLNFSSYSDLITEHITPLDLVEMSQYLDQEASKLPEEYLEASTQLKNIALVLDSYQNKLVVNIKATLEKLKIGAQKIERRASYGHKNLRDALTELLAQALSAQEWITIHGREQLQNVAKKFTSEIMALVDEYTTHVSDQFAHRVGHCQPMSRAYNASVDAVCQDVVLPLNGYWLSMVAALLLSLPSTIFAVILSRTSVLVKRSRRRRVDESQFSLDVFGDEDDIPLAQTSHKTTHHAHSSSSTGAHYSGHTPLGTEREPIRDRRSRSTSAANSARHTAHYVNEHGEVVPSAPAPYADDSWSPSAPPPTHHGYSNRPPPYNFHE